MLLKKLFHVRRPPAMTVLLSTEGFFVWTFEHHFAGWNQSTSGSKRELWGRYANEVFGGTSSQAVNQWTFVCSHLWSAIKEGEALQEGKEDVTAVCQVSELGLNLSKTVLLHGSKVYPTILIYSKIEKVISSLKRAFFVAVYLFLHHCIFTQVA